MPEPDTKSADLQSTQAEFSALLEQHRGIVAKAAFAYCSHQEARKELTQEILLGTVIGYRTLRQKADPEMHSRLDLLVTCASIQSAKSHLAELERFQRTAE